VTGLLHLATVLISRQETDNSQSEKILSILDVVSDMKAEFPHQLICEKYVQISCSLDYAEIFLTIENYIQKRCRGLILITALAIGCNALLLCVFVLYTRSLHLGTHICGRWIEVVD